MTKDAPDGHRAPDLHVVSTKDAKKAKEAAKTLALRAEALRHFGARYSHRPESQRTMYGSLRRLAREYSGGRLTRVEDFPWENLVKRKYTQKMWSAVAANHAPNTATKDASALRILLGHLRDVGLLTHEQYKHARSFEVTDAGGAPPPPGHYLTEEDLVAIIKTCEGGTGGVNTRIRDVALLLTLASSGMRGEELSRALLENVRLDDARIWLGYTKSKEPRWAFLHPTAVDALRRWLSLRGTAKGPLFVPLSRTGRPMPEHGRLSTHQIWKVVKRRAQEAGFADITPHDMRRFLISNLLETIDLVLVARIVGHKNPTTTAGYDRRPAERQRDAVATLSIPHLDSMITAVSGCEEPQ